jgi:hypothetical protein
MSIRSTSATAKTSAHSSRHILLRLAYFRMFGLCFGNFTLAESRLRVQSRGSWLRFNTYVVVHGSADSLLTSQVPLGRLDGNMSE